MIRLNFVLCSPPANYETMLLLPFVKEMKKFRATLAELYASLTSVSMLAAADDDDEFGGGAAGMGAGEFYPYVNVEFDIDLGTSLLH